jgi:heme-degrading monooxygenase HmoA
MAETIIMVRIRLHAEDVKAANAYAKAVQEALEGVDGFQGFGVWQNVQDPLARLVLFSYASPEAAQRGLVAISARRSLVERQGKGAEPAHVLGLKVIHSEGALAHGLCQAPALSISIRIAEPGYGADLIDVYFRTFAELAAIPGFAGMLVAVNENLPEEVVGLAAWDDEKAFRASLPHQKVYQVKLYERSFDDE